MKISALNRLPFWIAAMGVALFVALCYPRPAPPSMALDMCMGRLSAQLQEECSKLGLLPPTSDDAYYSSVLGSPNRCLKSRVRFRLTYRPVEVANCRIGFIRDDGQVTITASGQITTKAFWVIRRTTSHTRQYHFVMPTGAERMKLLLSACTAGTGHWNYVISGRISSWFECDKTGIPDIAFDLPRNQEELSQYRQWMVKVAGSDRLLDEWRNQIRMRLEHRGNSLHLIARSAGPDTTWNTSDDMLVVRDVSTGAIVKEAGF